MADRYDDFDVNGGCGYLSCVIFPYSLFVFPCLYWRMSTQEVFFEGNRLHFKYDCCLVKEDKLIPLDRIQDANIEANCCSRCFGVSILNIQTANGTPAPEAKIFAPRDPVQLRSLIMDRRDSVVQSSPSSGLDGQLPPAAGKSPLHAQEENLRELSSIRGLLERIERSVDRGVTRFERMEVA